MGNLGTYAVVAEQRLEAEAELGVALDPATGRLVLLYGKSETGKETNLMA